MDGLVIVSMEGGRSEGDNFVKLWNVTRAGKLCSYDKVLTLSRKRSLCN